MQGSIKLKAKNLLHKTTVRLFVISLISAIYRYGAFAGNIVGFMVLVTSDIVKSMTVKYGTGVTVGGLVIWECVSFTLMILSVSAVRMGEQFIYFTRSEGGKGRFLLLFKFFPFKKSLKSLALYTRINLLKGLWLFYFLLPGAICSFCAYYLYTIAYISQTVYFTLLTGIVLLFVISIIVWRISIKRYNGAPYYIALNESLTVSKAIEKSVRLTDGNLVDGFITDYSFIGWVLSCVFIIPLVYVIPYIKLSNALWVTEATLPLKPHPKQYSVTFYPLSGQHIN